MHGHVAARKILAVLAIAERAGLPRGTLLGRLGLAEADVADPDAWVPQAAWRDVWDLVVAHTGDPAVGLRAAAGVDPGYFGVIDYAVRSCATVRDAIPVAARYFRLANTWGRVDVAPIGAGGDAGLRVSRHIVGDEAMWLPRQGAEFALAVMVRVFRLATARPLPLARVTFRYPAPPDDAPHRAFFGCPVVFGAPADAIELPHAALALPMRAPDSRLRGVMEAYAGTLLAALAPLDASLAAQVRHHVAPKLSRGAPSIDEVARHLAMSGRSLQRRLADEGTTFRALVDDVRGELARAWLRGGMPPGEVAFLLGYSETSAFHRAFQGWTGTTPGSFARAAAGPDGPLSVPAGGPGANSEGAGAPRQ